MNLYVQLLAYIMLITPFGLFWHELGHVFAAYLMRARHITLTVGSGKPIIQGTLGHVTFEIRRILLFNSYTRIEASTYLSNKDKVIITSMGPIFSLLLSLLAYVLNLLIVKHLIWYILCLFNLWLGIINLIPFRIKGKQSDGYTILQTIKNKYD